MNPMNKRTRIIFLLAVVIIVTAPLYFLVTLFLSSGETAKLNTIRGVETCQGIPAYAYETALVFNPSDAQTLYIRSECFLKLAIERRDVQLCEQVQERKSWLFNGSAYSRERCLLSVQEALAADEAERMIPERIHRIQEFRIESNPEGGETIRIMTRGSQEGRYDLSLTLHNSDGTPLNQLHQEILSLGEEDITIERTIHVKDDLVQDFGLAYYESMRGKELLVTAKLELLVDRYRLEQHNLTPPAPSSLQSIAEQMILIRE